jgi:hypothetical protein
MPLLFAVFGGSINPLPNTEPLTLCLSLARHDRGLTGAIL